MKQKYSFKKIILHYILPILMAAAIFALDQYTKNLAVEKLKPQIFIPLIPGVFHLTFTYNTGMAWSMLSDQRGLLVGMSLIAIFCLGYCAFTDVLQSKLSRWALFAVLGGALGNFYDRIFRIDGVVDMFDFCLINFPVFNVADIFICVGGCVFMLCMVLEYAKRDREMKSQNVIEEYKFEIEEIDEDK